MEKSNSQYNETNIEIFRTFNQAFGKPEFDGAINLGAHIGEYTNFYIYMIVLFFIATLNIYNNKHSLDTVKEIVISWASALITLFIASVIGYICIQIIKNYTNMPRPFCSLTDIYTVAEITNMLDCKMSFPSGHVSFIIIMLASFWPLMNKMFKVLAFVLVVFVAITRIASGAHYPVDILGAVAITLPLTLYVHHKVANFVLHYENKRGFFARILKRLFKL